MVVDGDEVVVGEEMVEEGGEGLVVGDFLEGVQVENGNRKYIL